MEKRSLRQGWTVSDVRRRRVRATAIREAVRTLGLSQGGAARGRIQGERSGGVRSAHIGARVAAKARAGEVLVSSAVKDLMSQSESASGITAFTNSACRSDGARVEH